MGEKALLHIDALPVFPKLVVVFREKVGGFPTLSDDDDAKIQFVQCFSSSYEPHHPKYRMEQKKARSPILKGFGLDFNYSPFSSLAIA